MDFSAGIAFFFRQLGKLLFSFGSSFSLTSLDRGADHRDPVFRLPAPTTRPPHPLANHRTRAIPAPHPAQPLERGRHRLPFLQRIRLQPGVRLGGAVLSVHLERHHRRAGRARRPGEALDAVALRHALGHHGDAVSRLRARLLGPPLALPQGAAAVGIPQSASHRGSAHADHQFPRSSGRHLALRQLPRVLGGGRQRAWQLHVWHDRLSIRARPTPTSSWCCSSTPTSICSIRTCGLRSAGLPGAFLCRPRIIRCTTRPIRNTSTRISAAAWRCGTGCSARSMFRARSARRSPSASPIIPNAHTMKGELVDPLINAAGHLKPLLPRRRGTGAGQRTQASLAFIAPDARAPRPRAAIACAYRRRPPRSCRRFSSAPARRR